MTNVDLRDCECDPAAANSDLEHIMIMVKCVECHDVQAIFVVNVDQAADLVAKMQGVRFYGHATADGVQRIGRPAG